ncbi:S8 family serine peptidase [Halobaculum sp. WSA2]|uniref:S8 family serine peptidase n=1 Tax=Halobaculum saliterrae TaxID=2073113 RepID=A0A6B0T177_9EURY|nr:S8 family serine peptidase [Halobaculum saliterrae]MXR42411.1 S8 family serine peptidase [Halobaculum saliterrae]
MTRTRRRVGAVLACLLMVVGAAAPAVGAGGAGESPVEGPSDIGSEATADSSGSSTNDVTRNSTDADRAELSDPLRLQLSQVDDGERIPVLVVFETQPEESLPLGSLSATEARTQMKQLARSEQDRARSVLAEERAAGSAGEVTTFWSRNALAVSATEDVIKRLAGLQSVERIVYDRQVTVSDANSTGIPAVDRILSDYNTSATPAGYERSTSGEAAWGVEYIGADEVQQRGVTGEGVNVSVVDTGIDDDHPALQGQVVKWKDFTGNNASSPVDPDGHGTHVAGTVAGRPDAERAVGVAPGANLFGARALGADGSGNFSDVIAAFEWSAEQDADVISASLGAPPLTSETAGNATAPGVGGTSSHEFEVVSNASVGTNGSDGAAYKPSYVLVILEPTAINGTTIDASREPERAGQAVRNLSVRALDPNGDRSLDQSSAGLVFRTGEVPPGLIVRKFKPSSGRIDEAGNWTLSVQNNNDVNVTYQYTTLTVYPTNGSDIVSEAVNEIARTHDVVPVIAAGNSGALFGNRTIETPGAAETAITVGATEFRSQAVVAFSSRGPVGYGSEARPGVTVTAPGTSVLSTSSLEDGNGRQYESFSGTSMATPHVSGTIALMLAANPNMTRSDVRDTLRATAQDTPAPDAAEGAGVTDAWAAANASAPSGLNETGTPPQGIRDLFAGIGDTGEEFVDLRVDPVSDPAGDSSSAPDLRYANKQLLGSRLELGFADAGTANATVEVYIDADQNDSTGDPDQSGAEFRAIINRTFDGTSYGAVVRSRQYNETAGAYESTRNFSAQYRTVSGEFITLFPSITDGPYENTGPVDFHVVSSDESGSASDRLPDSGQLTDGNASKTLKTVAVAWNSSAGQPATDAPVTFRVIDEDTDPDTVVANATMLTDSEGRAVRNFSVGVGDYRVEVTDERGNRITQSYSLRDARVESLVQPDGFPNHSVDDRLYTVESNSTLTVNVPVYADNESMTPYEGPASVAVGPYSDAGFTVNDLVADDGVVTFTVDLSQHRLDELDDDINVRLALTGNYSNASQYVSAAYIDIAADGAVQTRLGPETTTVVPGGTATFSFQHAARDGNAVNATAAYEVTWITDRMVASLSSELPTATLGRLKTVVQTGGQQGELTSADRRAIRTALENISASRTARTVVTGSAAPERHGVGTFSVEAPVDARYGFVTAQAATEGAEPTTAVVAIEGRTSQYYDRRTEPAEDSRRYNLDVYSYSNDWGEHKEGDYLVPNDTYDVHVSLYDYKTDSYVDNKTVNLYTDGGDVYTVELNGSDTVVTVDAPDTDWVNASFDEREQQVYGVVNNATRPDGTAVAETDYIYPTIREATGGDGVRPDPDLGYRDGQLAASVTYENETTNSASGKRTLLVLTERRSFDNVRDVFVGFEEPTNGTITRNITDTDGPGPEESAEYRLGARTPSVDDNVLWIDDLELGGLQVETNVEGGFTAGGSTPVTVTVTDRNGDPVEGAAVTWRHVVGYEMDRSYEASVPSERPGSTRVGVTGPNGTVTFDVSVTVPDGVSAAFLQYNVGAATANASATDLQSEFSSVETTEQVTVNGTITEPDGTPAANGTVALWSRDSTGQTMVTTTNASGGFNVTLNDGAEYTYSFYGTEFDNESSLNVRDGSPDVHSFGNFVAGSGENLDRQLPEGYVLNVSVVDEDGDPVPADEFTLGVASVPGFSPDTRAGAADLPTDANGTLQFPNASATGIEMAGDATVEVEPTADRFRQDVVVREVTVTDATNVTVELDEYDRVNVTGQFVNETGTALEGDEVLVYTEASDSIDTVETDATGNFSATVRNDTGAAVGYRQRGGVGGANVSADGVPDLYSYGGFNVSGNTSLGTITLPEGHRVNVSVVDEDGDRVENAVLVARHWNSTDREAGFITENQTTDADGQLVNELTGPVSVYVAPPENASRFENRTYVRDLTVTNETNVTVTLNETDSETEPGPTVAVEDATVEEGNTSTVNVTLSAVPNGLQNFELAVFTDNNTTANITGATVNPTLNRTDVEIRDAGNAIVLFGADDDNNVTAGDGEGILAQVEVTGVNAGEANLTVEPVLFEDDSGGEFTPDTRRGSVNVTESTTDGGSGGGGDGGDGGDGGGDGGTATPIVALEEVDVGLGGTATTNLTISEVPNGLDSFEIVVETEDNTTAAVSGATIAAQFGDANVRTLDGGIAVEVNATDLGDNVTGGDTNVRLAEIEVTGVSPGNTTLTVVPERVIDDNGDSVTVDPRSANASVNGSVFEYSNFSVTPESGTEPLSVTGSVNVTNVGNEAGTVSVDLLVNGSVNATKTVTLEPGETRTVSVGSTSLDAGNYEVAIDGLEPRSVVVNRSDQVITADPTTTTTTETPGFTVVLSVFALLFAGLVAIRRD